MPIYWGPPTSLGNFGELAKERLEAATLIQKTQTKPTQNFQKHHPQRYNAWGRQVGSWGSTGPSKERNFQARGSRAGASSKKWLVTTYTSHVNNFFNAQNVTTCILVLTPQGPTQCLQVLMGRLIQVSHWESTVPPTELRVSDTGQLGPSNSSGVLNRLYSHPTSVTPTSSNSSVTGLTCSGDTNQEFIIKQGVPILVA